MMDAHGQKSGRRKIRGNEGIQVIRVYNNVGRDLQILWIGIRSLEGGYAFGGDVGGGCNIFFFFGLKTNIVLIYVKYVMYSFIILLKSKK